MLEPSSEVKVRTALDIIEGELEVMRGVRANHEGEIALKKRELQDAERRLGLVEEQIVELENFLGGQDADRT